MLHLGSRLTLCLKFSALQAVRNVTHTPAIHSFATRLYGDGFKADTLTHSTSRISSYTGRPLRPYIWRDYAARPAMKAVLEDVVRRAHRYCINVMCCHWGTASIISLPCRDEPAWEPQPSYPVDYVYLDQMHIPQVNELLRHTFWPDIDSMFILNISHFHSPQLTHFTRTSIRKPPPPRLLHNSPLQTRSHWMRTNDP